MKVAMRVTMKDDMDFLEEILKNIISYDLNDKEEGIRMLRDQIAHMQKRYLNASEK